ncbi:hypothetical protein GUJ93_ZPchr0001g30775 [Zizania palustris]|uniref:Uncharacterized protein n=1 Tax=Zizania palustris TaxID=103762 RepID=A0A8J5VL68_ZIZPA|nr:hypothetical protein GUJ93_ZPchr0001g30775 [Zizania palustris]
MFFQRKNSKKAKDSDGSQKDKATRRKNSILGSAKGGLGALALAGTLQSAKNDAEERAGNIQGDVKSRMETIIEKVKDIGRHSEASQSKEVEQGSEEQGKKDMEAVSQVLDKVNIIPEVVDKVKEEVTSLAHALHLGEHDKEDESDEKAKEGETTQDVDESASASKTEDSGLVEQFVEEIQAVVSAVQQQQQQVSDGAAAAEATSEAAAETSAEGDQPEEAARDVEKDDPKKRLDLAGFFAVLFERLCSPGNKKKE